MKIAGYLKRADFARRHLRLAAPYVTRRKIRNLVVNELEYRTGRTRLKSVPPFIKLESTPICHLSCPGCVHSDPGFKKALGNAAHLSLDRVRAVVDPVLPDLLGVSLSYSGEPLLNRGLIDIVRYLNRAKVYTSFPSNLSVPMTEATAERLVDAGLDLLMVSLDGASAETYGKFRVGGRFDLVTRNVRMIADAKKRLGMKTPYLLWKFIVFSHNRHEVPAVRRMAAAMGFDGVEFDADHDEPAGDGPATNAVRGKAGACFWAWNTTTVGWDGDVQPCCKQMGEISLGNAGQGLDVAWNSPAYSDFRASFLKGDDALHEVCRRCLGVGAA